MWRPDQPNASPEKYKGGFLQRGGGGRDESLLGSGPEPRELLRFNYVFTRFKPSNLLRFY